MAKSIPPITSTGRFRAKGANKRKSVTPGLAVKIGIGERKETIPKKKERVESIPSWEFVSKPKFTRCCPADKYLLIEKITEPAVRILKDVTEVVVVASLPQVKEKDIHIELHGDILEIAATAKDRFGPKKYTKEMLFPFIPDPRTVKTSFENDILEIRLQNEREKKGKKKR